MAFLARGQALRQLIDESLGGLSDIIEEVALMDALLLGMVDIVARTVYDEAVGPDVLVVLLVGILRDDGVELIDPDIGFLHPLIDLVITFTHNLQCPYHLVDFLQL